MPKIQLSVNAEKNYCIIKNTMAACDMSMRQLQMLYEDKDNGHMTDKVKNALSKIEAINEILKPLSLEFVLLHTDEKP